MLSIIINNIINIQHADANNADESRPTRMPANNTPSIDPFQKERYSIVDKYIPTYLQLLSQTFSKFSLCRDAPDEVPIRRRGTSSPGKHVCQSLLTPRQAAIIEYHNLGVDHLGG